MPGNYPTKAPDVAEALGDVDLIELLAGPHERGLVGARQLRDDFEDLIGETKLESLVVIIDDLDRCAPDRIVETLEAIKLFLAVPHVAFVIGADYRILRYAIGKRYEAHLVEAEQGAPDKVDLVSDYIEKLIQIPYYLPRLSPSELETYMSLLFCQLHAKGNFARVHAAFVRARAGNITTTFGHEQVSAGSGRGRLQRRLGVFLGLVEAHRRRSAMRSKEILDRRRDFSTR